MSRLDRVAFLLLESLNSESERKAAAEVAANDQEPVKASAEARPAKQKRVAAAR